MYDDRMVAYNRAKEAIRELAYRLDKQKDKVLHQTAF